MTVAIQNGLEHLGEALRRYGFDVVTYGEYPYPVDAFVYIGESMPITSSAADDNHEHHGIFMVNANGKNADEVAHILNRRTYTPLF